MSMMIRGISDPLDQMLNHGMISLNKTKKPTVKPVTDLTAFEKHLLML